MKKLKPPRLVTVAVFTTITIVFWVFYGLYNILTSDSFQKVPPEILAPIDPTLDTEVLDKLPGRIFFKKGEAEFFETSESTATASPTLVSTPSASTE